MRFLGLGFGGAHRISDGRAQNFPRTVADLHIWLDAARVETLHPPVGAVGQWDDRSGGAHHPLQENPALRPQSGVVAHNGLNVLSCAGARNVLSFATGNFDALSNAGQSTIYVVFKSTLASATQRLICETAATRYGLLLIGGRVVARHHTATSNQAVTPLYTADQAHIAFMRRDGVEVEARLDEGAIAKSWANDVPLSASRIEIGGRSSSGGQELQGWIGEIIVYRRALTAEEDQGVMRYLKDKWEI